MHTTTLFIAAFAGFTAAQSTVSLFIPGAEEGHLVASVVASDKTATTYSIGCPYVSDLDATTNIDCGYYGGFLFTQGPATAAYSLSTALSESGSSELYFTATVQCSLAGTISAVCTASYGGKEANDPGVETATLTGTEYSFEKLTLTSSIQDIRTLEPGYAQASATKASASGVIASGLPTISGLPVKTGSGTAAAQSTLVSSQSGSGSGTAASKSTGTTSPSSSTSQAGAQAMITARPVWIAGGAAMAWALL